MHGPYKQARGISQNVTTKEYLLAPIKLVTEQLKDVRQQWNSLDLFRSPVVAAFPQASTWHCP